jgi:hypothetical protein
LQGATDN